MKVYFVQEGEDGPIKIGLGNGSLAIRLSSLQVGNPRPLRLMGAIDGTRVLERQLHYRFENCWLRGEWYTASKELLEFIKREVEPIEYRPGEAGRPKKERRMPEPEARAIWLNCTEYETNKQALIRMTDWTQSAAYAAFGPSGRGNAGKKHREK